MSRPDWIEALAAACERESQSRVALRIGYSPATVSQVLHGKYRGDVGAVEQAVRGALMEQSVLCPGLRREIPMDRCIAAQRAPYSSSNHMRVTLYRACRSGCAHSRLTAASNRGDQHAER